MAVVGSVLRTTLVGFFTDSQTWNNVWHHVVVSGSETNYDTILAAIEGAFDVAYALLETEISIQVETTDIIMSEWDFTAHEWDGKAQSAAGCLDGSASGEALPAGNAVVVRFITEELRRQARKFIPGIAESRCNGNDIASLLITAAVNWAGAINNDIVAGGVTLRPCTFNDTVGSPHYETESEFVQDFFVNSKSGYQRNRQVGAGI